MTIPAATPVTPAGVLVSGVLATVAASSQVFDNDGRVMIAIHNGGGSGVNATFVTQEVIADGPGSTVAVADRTVAIAAGETRLVGPFAPSAYNDGNGQVTLNFDTVTSVTIQAFRMAPAGA